MTYLPTVSFAAAQRRAGSDGRAAANRGAAARTAPPRRAGSDGRAAPARRGVPVRRRQSRAANSTLCPPRAVGGPEVRGGAVTRQERQVFTAAGRAARTGIVEKVRRPTRRPTERGARHRRTAAGGAPHRTMSLPSMTRRAAGPPSCRQGAPPDRPAHDDGRALTGWLGRQANRRSN